MTIENITEADQFRIIKNMEDDERRITIQCMKNALAEAKAGKIPMHIGVIKSRAEILITEMMRAEQEIRLAEYFASLSPEEAITAENYIRRRN
jgi:hypothetical protein